MFQQAEYVEVSFFKSGSRDKGVSRKQTGGSKQLIKKHLQAGASLIPRPSHPGPEEGIPTCRQALRISKLADWRN
jgi:hypothetical protein